MNREPGQLFVVATPIGNLKDITLRAIECLERADLIAAEDTRRTRALLSHLGIRKRMISCNEHNEAEKASQVLELLENGGSCVLVSDAGTPSLSDPGARMVEKIRREGFKVIPIPGPSAVAAALSVSGFYAGSFHFAGFLPSKSGERRKRLKELANVETTLIFFEAPHRLMKCLQDMLSVLGDRRIFLAREMTKCHETYIVSTISELMSLLQHEKVRGELTLVVEGPKGSKKERFDVVSLETVLECLLGNKHLSVKEASTAISKMAGISRGTVYDLALGILEEKDNG